MTNLNVTRSMPLEVPMPRRPAVSLLDATRANAIDALAREDASEFARLSLDVAGLLNRVAEVDAVRAELEAEIVVVLVTFEGQ